MPILGHEEHCPYKYMRNYCDTGCPEVIPAKPLTDEGKAALRARGFEVFELGEVRTTSPTGGQKGTKPARYDLIPPEALEQLAKLYGFGASKYDDHNWRNGFDWSKSYAALQRHANQFWAGQDNDEETGLPHMASVAWHAFTLLTFMQEHPLYDDRYKPGDGATVPQEEKEKD